jgi:hypothetical protein
MSTPIESRHLEYTSQTVRALGYRFALQTTDRGLGRLFDDLYSPCADQSVEPEVWYSAVASQTGSGVLTLHVDDAWIGDIERPSWLLSYLTWHVNREVVARSTNWVLVHAAAASCDGIGVLLPARPEAGKTTLVAGLIRAGFDYLTDEAAAINADTLNIDPYPKPLSIDRGAWAVLGGAVSQPNGVADRFFVGQRQVNPCSIRENSISDSVVPSLVVFPEYVEGSPTVLEPLSGTQGLLRLLQNTFDFARNGPRNLSVLAELVRQSACYRLVNGDLGEACSVISRLVEQKSLGRPAKEVPW